MTHPFSPVEATTESSSRDTDVDRVRLSVVEDGGTPDGRHPLRIGTTDVARFAREVWESNDPVERLQRGVRVVVDLVAGCDHAGASVMARRKLLAGPVTDAVALSADQLQQDLDEGPRLEVVRTGGTAISHDLAHEPRWERWSARVVDELGIGAAMSIMLFDDTHVYGSLNLYADRAHAWSTSAVALAEVLATHLSLALGDALQIEHRGRAMESRTVIGQAQGILMERFNLTADGAYAVLLRTSQQHHLKVAVVAADLVRTARLPDSSYHVRTPPAPDPA